MLRRLRGCVLVAAAFVSLGGVGVCAEPRQTATTAPMMPIPGGTARLLRVAGIAVPVEPARALLVIIRNQKAGPEGGKASPPAVYLDAVSRYWAAARRFDSGQARQLTPFLDAAGFVFNGGEVQPSTDAAAAQRTHLLQLAGYPVEQWMAVMASAANPTLSNDDKIKTTRSIVSAVTDVDDVPALLPVGVWSSEIFRRDVGANLAAAILGDRRASLLYHGLFSLDDETVDSFARSPALLAVAGRDAAAFAVFADGLVIRDNRVIPPGGLSAVPAWERLVGQRITDPGAFISTLFGRDEGRLAWFFHTVAHADRAHQACALGQFVEAPEERASYVQAMYRAFLEFDRRGSGLLARPFLRPAIDPAVVLQQLRVMDDGRVAPPNDVRVWEAAAEAIGEHGSRPASIAPWIVRSVSSQAVPIRSLYLETVLFAQRLAMADGSERERAFSEAVGGFANHRALVTTVERLGFTNPADYVAALRAGDRLNAGSSLAAAVRLAQWQGALTLVVRLHDVGFVNPATARELARSLFAVGESTTVADWVVNRLLPETARATAGTTASAEDLLVAALAGLSVGRPTRTVQWEEQTYRVDPAVGERARIRRIREKQADVSLDSALELHRAATMLLAEGAQAAALHDAARRVREAIAGVELLDGATLFGWRLPSRRYALMEAVRAYAEKPGDSTRKAAGEQLIEATDLLLADVLASFAYALAIGDPDASSLLAGNPARRHDFAFAIPSSAGWWRVAEETRVSQQMVIRGSLLGLDRALGRDWLRPITQDAPEVGRRMSVEEVRGLGEAVAALNPFRLTDAGASTLLDALARGRARVKAALQSPADLEALCSEAGIEGARRRLLRLVVTGEPADAWQYFSLGELLQLGHPAGRTTEMSPWGIPGRALDGTFGVRMPESLAWQHLAGRPTAALMHGQVADLQLRIVEVLADLKLPPELVPGVLSYATWDLVMTAPMADEDDWLAVVRTAQAISRDRIADYVSALTTDGALVPVRDR